MNRGYASAHLELPRRAAFRERRDEALVSCGFRTSVLTAGDPARPVGALVLVSQAPVHADSTGYIWLAGTVSFSLHLGPNVIGRQRDNDVVVGDETLHVSRRHCVVVVHADRRVEVFDLASLNGTYVNGERIERPTMLAGDDSLRLGSSISFRLALYDANGN